MIFWGGRPSSGDFFFFFFFFFWNDGCGEFGMCVLALGWIWGFASAGKGG